MPVGQELFTLCAITLRESLFQGSITSEAYCLLAFFEERKQTIPPESGHQLYLFDLDCINSSRYCFSTEPAAQWFTIVSGVRPQMLQGCLLLHPMGGEDQTIRIVWAESSSHFASKMTREPFLET